MLSAAKLAYGTGRWSCSGVRSGFAVGMHMGELCMTRMASAIGEGEAAHCRAEVSVRVRSDLEHEIYCLHKRLESL